MSDSSNFETFGSWLRRRRRMLDLTQEQLGRQAGCSGAAIRKFEANERKPSRPLAELLAEALQIPVQDRETFLQIARGISPTALPVLPAPAGFVPPVAIPSDNLPAPLTSLVNRVNDLAAVADLLRDPDVRWLTLLGPPGIGKTRLAIQSGRQALVEYPGGVWFVDLASLENPAHVLPAVSRALESFDLPPAASLEQLAGVLKGQTLLLILDNFEHVSEGALDIAGLLKRCARLKVLATSRIPLQIYGEHLYRVPPLSIPPPDAAQLPQDIMSYEAVQLFVARVRQHQPAFTVDLETVAPLVKVVQTLGGIPLALELAAASLQRMSLVELDRLLHHLEGENWLWQVRAPARDLPERQHTLENVVAWSYSLLTSAQKDLFRKLAVFTGWFDVEAVRVVCYNRMEPEMQVASGEVRPLLDNLADHSLLVLEITDEAPAWRMLEVIHEYAALQLTPATRSELEKRLASYLLERLQAIAGVPDQNTRETFFNLHINNLQASLKWTIAGGHTELGFQLAHYLDELWSSHGYFKEVLTFMKQLFTLPDDSPLDVRLLRLHAAADLAWQQHDFESSLSFTEQAIELRRQHGLSDQSAEDINRMGRIYIEHGEYALARQALDECLSLVRSFPDSLNPGAPLAQLGELSLFEGRLAEAKRYLKEALQYLNSYESIFLAITTVDLAEIALAEQDFTQAQIWLRQASDYAHLHMRRTLVYLSAAAGYCLLAPGQGKAGRRSAASLLGAIEALAERSGVVLSPFYRNLNQRRCQLAQQRLSGEEWQAAYRKGHEWSAEIALEQARQASGAKT